MYYCYLILLSISMFILLVFFLLLIFLFLFLFLVFMILVFLLVLVTLKQYTYKFNICVVWGKFFSLLICIYDFAVPKYNDYLNLYFTNLFNATIKTFFLVIKIENSKWLFSIRKTVINNLNVLF